jgi:hypothetical protein
MKIQSSIAAALFALLTLSAPLVHAQSPEDAQCTAWAGEILDEGADACEELCAQARDADGYDYRKGLSEAYRSRAGLSRLFEYTARSSIIGAAGDAQACTLYALLLHWGDARYAQTLAKHSKDVRGDVVGLLDYAGIRRFERRFPKTYALSDHER